MHKFILINLIIKFILIIVPPYFKFSTYYIIKTKSNQLQNPFENRVVDYL